MPSALLPILALLLLFAGFKSVKVVRDGTRLVVFRLGRLASIREPGLNLIIPFVETGKVVDLDAELPGWASLPAAELDKRIRERAQKACIDPQ